MSQRFCTNCGAAFVDGAAFCVSCGTPAQPGGSAQPTPQPDMPPSVASPPAAAAAAPAHPPPAPPAAAAPQYANHGGFQHPPPAYPAGHPAAAPAAGRGPSTWTWQRWVLLAVGAVLLLSVLVGVLGRLTNANGAVVGRWASDSRCLGTITLNADGRFVSPNGGIGHWTLRGDRLTLSGAVDSSTMRLVASTRNSITLVTDDGARETLVRC